MNMPMHIMAKPTHVLTIIWRDGAASKASDITQSDQGSILRPDADCQYRGIRDRKAQCKPRQAKTQWQDGNLANDDKIIRM
jgi:hypothetical protein